MRSMSCVGRVTKPCAIMAPPPASAKVRDCGKASAVRAMRSCSRSRDIWLGCRARRVDQRTPRRAYPRREVHLIPQANQLRAVDQFTDVIQRALHEHDLVQIAPPDRTGKIPPERSHRTSRGFGPDQNSLAGRPVLPWSDPRSSSSVRGTATSCTHRVASYSAPRCHSYSS